MMLYDALKRTLKNKKIKRMYIPEKLGVSGFFEKLNYEGVSYVVMRWFEQLPHVDNDEDIDMLVSDEDLEKVRGYLSENKKKGVPCDIYSVSGMPGSDYRGVSYYPPYLASEIISSSIIASNGVKRPSELNHFLSMVYHVLFHKGYLAGLAVRDNNDESKRINPEHDYSEVIYELSRKSDICIQDTSMESLLKILEEYGWVPPRDTLEKLAKRNEWILDRFFKNSSMNSCWHGLAVFIIRDKGSDLIHEIKSILINEGFYIVDEGLIDSNKRKSAALNIRGGNWHRGPWPKSGGFPAYFMAVFDILPKTPKDKDLEKHFALDNKRIIDAKVKIRNYYNESQPSRNHCNVVHSSDNADQAIDYLRVLSHEFKLEEIDKTIKSIRSEMEIPWPIIKSLSNHGRRAVVNVIEYKGGLAVCKTFKPGFERFKDRELRARELSEGFHEVLPVLEVHGMSIIFPYYENATDIKSLNVDEMILVKKVILNFRRQGFELIDFKPSNIMRSSEGELIFYDFEFLQETEVRESTLKGCYCWYGCPDDGKIDIPQGLGKISNPYSYFWKKKVFLPRFFAVCNIPRTILILLRELYKLKAGLADFIFNYLRLLDATVYRSLRYVKHFFK